MTVDVNFEKIHYFKKWMETHQQQSHVSRSTSTRAAHDARHRSVAEYRLFYRALLQKRPTILRSLLDLSRSTSTSTAHDARNRSVAEYRLFYRVLLQKRLVILRSLRIVASP